MFREKCDEKLWGRVKSVFPLREQKEWSRDLNYTWHENIFQICQIALRTRIPNWDHRENVWSKILSDQATSNLGMNCKERKRETVGVTAIRKMHLNRAIVSPSTPNACRMIYATSRASFGQILFTRRRLVDGQATMDYIRWEGESIMAVS